MSTLGTPPATIASASPSFAQQMPIAPASSCLRAMRGVLWALACGRTAHPVRRDHSAMRAMFRSSTAASTTSAGVSSASRCVPIGGRYIAAHRTSSSTAWLGDGGACADADRSRADLAVGWGTVVQGDVLADELEHLPLAVAQCFHI